MNNQDVIKSISFSAFYLHPYIASKQASQPLYGFDES
jgi:hypothetical protein